ncbi:MAG: hypothetical protein ABI604_10435 [Nitrospirota bacterium]
MKQSSVGIVAVLVAALAVPIHGIAASEPVMADLAVLGAPNSQLASSTPTTTGPSQPPLALSSSAASSTDVQDIPSIHGRYSLGGRTLLPYIGAGFAGGYGSEFNRSLNGAPPTQSDVGLRSQFGQIVSPNEFRLGVHIPF